MLNVATSTGTGDFVKLDSAQKASKREHAYAIIDGGFGVEPFGYKKEDWDKKFSTKTIRYYYRNANGAVGSEFAGYTRSGCSARSSP